jgi:hypothetical protein
MRYLATATTPRPPPWMPAIRDVDGDLAARSRLVITCSRGRPATPVQQLVHRQPIRLRRFRRTAGNRARERPAGAAPLVPEAMLREAHAPTLQHAAGLKIALPV